MNWSTIAYARVLQLLDRWRQRSEADWYDIPDHPGLGCYGTGYNSWGVQTNQKYLSAMAVLAERGEQYDIPAAHCDAARERALEALRFSLRSHCTGDLTCTDGTSWGHTWISSLGVERMMHGVLLLQPYFSAEDHALLRRMLVSETDWIARSLVRGKSEGVVAGLWNKDGCNVPESNIWNGAVLWRTAAHYPDEPDAEFWRAEAHRFLVNSVSIPADEHDQRLVAGKPIREWFIGANFFPNYALDHHGYLNVGYQVICLSNAAMLHFDLRAMEAEAPESLHHHQGDLWSVVRREVFADGRLARIGGDSRVRYAYCQEYLLPSLAYAADQFGDRHAAGLVNGQLDWIAAEAEHHGDGSFYGSRLSYLRSHSPYYTTRLESDRACALGQLVRYAEQLADPGEPDRDFEASVAGGWAEPDHGAVMHRSPTRLASFVWRAYGLTQGLCLPPDDGHLADWCQNLAGEIRVLGDEGAAVDNPGPKRRLVDCGQTTFDGGFVTWGQVLEGCRVALAEGWSTEQSMLHQLAFAALPDGHTVVGVQRCRALDHRVLVGEVKGLRLNVPNDLFNGFARTVVSESGKIALRGAPGEDELLPLHSDWAVIDDRLAVVGIAGGQGLVVDRSAARRGGMYQSLHTEQLIYGGSRGSWAADPGACVLDVAWAVIASGSASDARDVAASGSRQTNESNQVVTVTVPGRDHCSYRVMMNFGNDPASVEERPPAGAVCLGGGGEMLPAGQAALWQCPT